MTKQEQAKALANYILEQVDFGNTRNGNEASDIAKRLGLMELVHDHVKLAMLLGMAPGITEQMLWCWLVKHDYGSITA